MPDGLLPRLLSGELRIEDPARVFGETRTCVSYEVKLDESEIERWLHEELLVDALPRLRRGIRRVLGAVA
jgi:hypothetical protein